MSQAPLRCLEDPWPSLPFSLSPQSLPLSSHGLLPLPSVSAGICLPTPIAATGFSLPSCRMSSMKLRTPVTRLWQTSPMASSRGGTVQPSPAPGETREQTLKLEQAMCSAACALRGPLSTRPLVKAAPTSHTEEEAFPPQTLRVYPVLGTCCEPPDGAEHRSRCPRPADVLPQR